MSRRRKSPPKDPRSATPTAGEMLAYLGVFVTVIGLVVTAYFGYLANRPLSPPTNPPAQTNLATPLPPPLAEIFPQVDGGVKDIYKNYGGLVSDDFVTQNCVHSGPYGLQLIYDMKEDSSGGWIVSWRNSPASYFDAVDFSAFTFWVKGIRGGETFQIGLKDTSGNVVKVESETLLVVSSDWMPVTVPLSSFKEVNIRSIENVNFGFDKDDGTGSICIDDISFTP